MVNAYDKQLTQAYELIEQDQHDKAREILSEVVAQHPNDPDVLWVYAHALEDEKEATVIIEKIATIDKNYPGLDTLRDSSSPVSDDTFDNDLNLDDEFATDEADQEQSTNPIFRRLIIAAVVVALVVIGALILLSGQGGDDDNEQQPTRAAQENTPQPTLGNVLAQSADSLEDAFGAFVFAEDGLITESTNLGETQIAALCSVPDVGFSEVVSQAFDVFAGNVSSVTTDAVAVRIVNCDTSDVINTLGVSTDNLQDYADGSIDNREFRGTWNLVN